MKPCIVLQATSIHPNVSLAYAPCLRDTRALLHCGIPNAFTANSYLYKPHPQIQIRGARGVVGGGVHTTPNHATSTPNLHLRVGFI